MKMQNISHLMNTFYKTHVHNIFQATIKAGNFKISENFLHKLSVALCKKLQVNL